MVWDAVIAGGSSLLGGALGNKSSAKEAKKNREFQLMMAQNAHQFEVADLRAAGLNPRLSAMGGSGASASGGSAAPQSDIVTPAVSSALAARRNRAEVDNMEEQNKNMHETNKLIQAQTSSAKAQAANYGTQTEATRLENVGRAIDAEWQQKFGVTGSAMNSATNTAKSVGNAAASAWKWINPKNLLLPFKK